MFITNSLISLDSIQIYQATQNRKAVHVAVTQPKDYCRPKKRPAITSYSSHLPKLNLTSPNLQFRLILGSQPTTPTMAHSKRNTSLPHFTSYERNLLRSTWGTKRSVIGRDSFLPFASCRLCLQPARAPVVACASNGDLFCRECAINDLLAQRQEIKRLEKDREEAKKRIAEDEERMLEKARRKDLRDFELVSMGLDAARSGANNGRKRKVGVDEEEEERALAAFKAREVEVNGVRKKVFELDEKEMARVAAEERERLKGEIKKEKVWTCIDLWVFLELVLVQGTDTCDASQDSSKSALPSFWVPSLTPSTDHDEIIANKAVKLTPICPGSNETHKHSYSLKSLVDVHFTEEKAEDGTVSRVCPSCKKNLSNGLKAMRTCEMSYCRHWCR